MEQEMAHSRKALIIGAGIAGPSTAIFLKHAGIDAEVFEAWPYSTGIGGGLQIAPNGMHVLAEIGLADELIRRGSIAESFDFYSKSGAPSARSIGTCRNVLVSRPSICAAPR
jgi:2-polyprenyl-6-methoxyphenol hydroxylase-like FAD-dependent oxidoreductase